VRDEDNKQIWKRDINDQFFKVDKQAILSGYGYVSGKGRKHIIDMAGKRMRQLFLFLYLG
jgi:hypothetical protein